MTSSISLGSDTPDHGAASSMALGASVTGTFGAGAAGAGAGAGTGAGVATIGATGTEATGTEPATAEFLTAAGVLTTVFIGAFDTTFVTTCDDSGAGFCLGVLSTRTVIGVESDAVAISCMGLFF